MYHKLYYINDIWNVKWSNNLYVVKYLKTKSLKIKS